MEGEDSDIQIGDTDNFRSDKNQQFNHQALVMEAIRKCIEAGSHEMRAGFVNTKEDMRGNITYSYVEDSRLKFVQNVQNVIMVLICDFDDEATNNIKALENRLFELKVRLLKEQWNWFEKLPPTPKIQYAAQITRYAFNKDLGWYHAYINEELNTYRLIFQELTKLTKRLDFYQIDEFYA